MRPEGHELNLETQLYDLAPYKSMLESLELVAKDGPDAFYKGQVGKVIVDETGGQITQEDLKEYNVSETRHGVQTKIGSFQVRIRLDYVIQSCDIGHMRI